MQCREFQFLDARAESGLDFFFRSRWCHAKNFVERLFHGSANSTALVIFYPGLRFLMARFIRCAAQP
jgi:hypothetical protein